MTDQYAALRAQLEEKMQTGSEAEVKEFVLAHFSEFPEETQQELATAMFEDALGETVAARSALINLKEKAAGAIDAFESTGE